MDMDMPKFLFGGEYAKHELKIWAQIWQQNQNKTFIWFPIVTTFFISCQIFLLSKEFWCKKLFLSWKLLALKDFLLKFLFEKFFVQKNFWCRKIFVAKKFSCRKFLVPKNSCAEMSTCRNVSCVEMYTSWNVYGAEMSMPTRLCWNVLCRNERQPQ